MAGESGVVRLQIKFKGIQKIVRAKEVQTGRGVGIVLVLGRLFRFGLDVELTFETDGLFMVHRQMKERAEVVHLAFEVSSQESAIAFASSPETVTRSLERVGDLNGFFYLSPRVRKNVGVAARGSAVGKAGVGKQTSGAPQQPNAGALLLFLQGFDNEIKVPMAFAQAPAFGSDIAVMEGIKRRAQFFDEFKGNADTLFRHFKRVGAVFPRANGCARAKHVGQLPSKGMPVSNRKAQMVFHRLSFDQFRGVVMLEGEGVF